jgi:uncharacterized membrane protein YhfC
VSQLIHIPLLLSLQPVLQTPGFVNLSPAVQPWLTGLFYGFLAGVCEEPMRWLAYKVIHERGHNVRSSIVLGIGHGGVESVALVGFSVLASFVTMLQIRYIGLEVPGITPEMVNQFFATDWSLPLAGAIERLSAISIHIGMSVVVWKAIHHRSWLWFLAAIMLHTIYDGVAVAFSSLGLNVWLIEGVFVVFAVISILWSIRTVRAHMLLEEDELIPQ